jgi:hypothetical protein
MTSCIIQLTLEIFCWPELPFFIKAWSLEERNMLSHLVEENYAINFFFMLIATCAQHGIFMYSNNTQRLSIDVPNVGYTFG